MPGKILVLDDEENYAKMMAELLRAQRFQVDMCVEPREALESLNEKIYDLIILDFKMPSMNGLDFLIQARKINDEQPIMMVSGMMNTQDLLQVANMGVSNVLEKPFDTDSLIEHVRRYVAPLPEGVKISDEAEAEEDAVADEELQQQAKTKEKTYPQDLLYLAGVSPSSQDFIQAVWDSVNEYTSTFILAPQGSEFELLVREISNWRGFNDVRVYFTSAMQLRSTSVQEMIASIPQDKEISKVVAVTDVDETTVEQQKYLYEFIEEMNAKWKAGNGLKFIFRINNISFLEPEEGQDVTPLQGCIADRLLRFFPLADRLSDLAFYAKRYLEVFAECEERPNKKHLNEEAMGVLLGYDWPFNFLELIDTLRRAVILGKDDFTGAGDLITIIRRNCGADAVEPKTTDLGTYLKEHQQLYLDRICSHVNGDIKDALSSSGVDPTVLQDGMELKDLDLLCPELLQLAPESEE